MKEPTFNFMLKSTQSPKRHEESTGIEDGPLGPIAMSYEEKMGWTSEKLVPNSKHWKRLAREPKGKNICEGLGLESRKELVQLLYKSWTQT